MKPGIVITIIRKELLEIFRDKRTLIAMVFVPLVLYPVLFIVFSQWMIVQESRQEEKNSKVALFDPCEPTLREWIQADPNIDLIAVEDPCMALMRGELDAVVYCDKNIDTTMKETGTVNVRVAIDKTEDSSRKAGQRLQDILRKRSQELLNTRLGERGLDKSFTEPVRLEITDVAPPEKTTGFLMGQVLPMILVIMVAVGAFYPAVDLTAGEKERGTFETLLSTPTQKVEIVCGKFFTSFILAMLVAFLNLVSMSLTLLFVLAQSAEAFGVGGASLSIEHITLSKALLVFAVLVPLAFFICSVMMSLAIFARSYKEAQNYVSPFYMLVVFPAMMTTLPGLEINEATQLIPIANVALLFKSMLMETVSWELYFGVFISTAVYAMLALVVAVWLFQREDVILSEEKGIPLTIDRSAFEPRTHLTIGMALMMFGVGLLVLFYGGSYFQSRNVIWGMLITQWALLLTPVILVLWFIKIDLRTSLRLQPPAAAAVPATIMVAAGMLVIVSQVMQWQNAFLPTPVELNEQMEKMMGLEDQTVSIWLLLLAFALSPAVCEEIAFRGAILSGIRSRFGDYGAAVIVGVMFGLFHLSVYRIIPTAILGIMITWLVLRSGSIYIGMLAHLLHNGTLILFASKKFPASWQPILSRLDSGVPLAWFIVACAVVIAGLVLMELAGKRSQMD